MNMKMTPPADLVSPDPSLWQWSPSGDAILWTDSGTTALMTAHLIAICKPLSSHLRELPSLTAIVMIASAMGRGWSESTARARVSMLIRTEQSDEVDRIAAWLVALGSPVPDTTRGIDAAAEYLGDLLGPRNELQASSDLFSALDAIAWMEAIVSETGCEVEWRDELHLSNLAEAATAIRRAASCPNDSSKRTLRRQTGLFELPTVPIELEPLPAVNPYKTLLMSLRSDIELGPLAMLALDCSSTFSLPRRPSDPEQLPIGGVSDIANRGRPEQLLMTELALDPDLLLARIALGQALYLRRESPPQQRPIRRCVLIENGIRTWGLTRVYATALTLAIAAAEERCRGAELDVWTVAGLQYWAEDLRSHSGIVDQLARLHPDAEPGDAIMALLRNVADCGDESAEPLLVISRNTDRDPVFRRKIEALPQPYLVAVIDLAGLVRLIRRTPKGDELLHQQRLKLPEKRLGVARETRGELPMYLRIVPCPLRLPPGVTPLWQTLGRGPTVWHVNSKHRLLYFNQHSAGGIEIMTLPPGRIVAGKVFADDCLRLVIEVTAADAYSARHKLVVAWPDGTHHQVDIQPVGGMVKRFVLDENYLWQIDRNSCVFDYKTGEILGGQNHTGTSLNNLYVVVENKLYKERFNGEKFERWLVGPARDGIGGVYRGRGGVPTAFAVDLSWIDVYAGDQVEHRKTGVQISQLGNEKDKLEVVATSPDGSSCAVRLLNVSKVVGDLHPTWTGADRSMIARVSSDSPHVSFKQDTALGILAAVNGNTSQFLSPRALRTKLQAIGAEDGAVFIARRQANFSRFTLVSHVGMRILKLVPTTTPPRESVPFDDEVIREPKNRWSLRRATLGRGEAWIDSRGLLHLKNALGHELTLVLDDKHVSGWSSQAGVFGSRYYIGQNHDIPVPEAVISMLESFSVSSRRYTAAPEASS